MHFTYLREKFFYPWIVLTMVQYIKITVQQFQYSFRASWPDTVHRNCHERRNTELEVHVIFFSVTFRLGIIQVFHRIGTGQCVQVHSFLRSRAECIESEICSQQPFIRTSRVSSLASYGVEPRRQFHTQECLSCSYIRKIPVQISVHRIKFPHLLYHAICVRDSGRAFCIDAPYVRHAERSSLHHQ